jgi:hypothetical protein
MVPSYWQAFDFVDAVTSRVRDAATRPNDQLIEIIIKFDQ